MPRLRKPKSKYTAHPAADEYASEESDVPQPKGNRKQSTALQKAPKTQQDTSSLEAQNQALMQQIQAMQATQNPAPNGQRIAPVRQSRIKDRPEKTGDKDSSLKINIELDLEVEVDLYARVKGDVTIGLM
ncbi:MAG: hypothetical protein LQ346_008299 [Caloplaca aetnensis]|nr:MAG: hypothetical protein LQ346_008299 [Caloplaca aetnensis]